MNLYGTVIQRVYGEYTITRFLGYFRACAIHVHAGVEASIIRAYNIDDLYHIGRSDPPNMVKIVYIVCACIANCNDNYG